MPDVTWNREMWNDQHDWPKAGEEWSEGWGGAEAQWFGAIFPRVHRLLPAEAILEIAPGRGRWTRFLLPMCASYLGIDLSERAVQHCRKEFERHPKAAFAANDGLSLDRAPDGAFDFVFSFDSLVHVEQDVLAAYVAQALRKLKPTGVAFFHHSNVLEFADRAPDPAAGFRARSVSAGSVRDLVQAGGGAVLIQELINWTGGADLDDCLTLFARANSGLGSTPVVIRNPGFDSEIRLVGAYQSPWSRIEVRNESPALDPFGLRADRDRAAADRDRAAAERDRAAAERDAALARIRDGEEAMGAIRSSLVWRLASPLWRLETRRRRHRRRREAAATASRR